MRNLAIICILTIILGGCDSLRFAPSQPMKQSAEITFDLAHKVNREGTEPDSQASRQLVQGTQVALSYMGRPKVSADAEQFETVTIEAQTDAESRPDPWQVADAALELGIGVAALLGGVYGTRAVGFLQQARAKSKALQEIVAGNELFKKKADPMAKSQFKEAQNVRQVTLATKNIVAQAKLSNNEQIKYT